MSALGHKQTFAVQNVMSASANSGPMQRSKKDRYSITSSARARSVGVTLRPSVLAVLRLMASSNLVGWTTGRSAGIDLGTNKQMVGRGYQD